jgi:UPF0755 protein
MNAGRIVKISLLALLVLIIIGGLRVLDIYSKAFAPNVMVSGGQAEEFIFVHSCWTYDSVFHYLSEQNLLKNPKSFQWTAQQKKYGEHIRAGRYLIRNRMSNNELINMLRSGKQVPVQLTFNNIRTLEELAGKISRQIEPDSVSLIKLFRNESIQKTYGFSKYTMACMFIPNTYEFYWNTTAEKFLERMNREYSKFWNKIRLAQADRIKMSQEEVITLASIVDEETYMDSEKKRIAGVYINRLEKGMRLQADPTVIFGLCDLSIKRVLKKHYQTDTPYNTYLHDGLPPGPICIPEVSSIDAVLNYEKHQFIYFCAKSDLSGYHNFARTLSEHNANARAYQRALNLRRIYK